MSVVLPTPENNSGSNDWSDVFSNDKALKEALETTQAELATAQSKISALELASPVTGYTPKIIAAEQSRENVAFGTLATPDEITGVVVPEGGLVVVSYSALVKSSVGAAGSAAIFVGSNQLKKPGSTVPVVSETATVGTGFTEFATSSGGLKTEGTGTSYVTTGMTLPSQCVIDNLAAGTYAISIRFKASSGTVTRKESRLRIAVFDS